jgi:hypothetical protein
MARPERPHPLTHEMVQVLNDTPESHRNLFSYDGFEELIRAVLSAGYTFARFDEPASDAPQFYLRHDVDISPRSANRLGQIAADFGVRSNFFFLIDAETYNIFNAETLGTLETLSSHGHCVGLHIDQTVIGDEEADVARTIHWFSETIRKIDPVVSFHRPAPSVLGRTYKAFINAYDPRFFGEGLYFSDSRRSDAFWQPLNRALHDKQPLIQLLLHPEWWYNEPNVSELLALLRRRRINEFDNYLKRCFNKVFGDLIDDEDSSPRV